MHRSNLRHLGIVSSSRIEGEFGAIWFLRLHANTTLRHAFEKLRWASNRRRKKKIAYVEDSLSKWVKRKSDIIDDEDWQFLVKNFTKYYRLYLEKVLGQVKHYKCQLVKAEVPQLEFRVWRVVYEESDIEVADDESESSDSDDACSVHVDLTEIGPQVVNAESDTSHVPCESAPRKFADMKPFEWRRVRSVKVVYSIDLKKYLVICSCKRCEGTCVPCAHQLNVMECFQQLRLRELVWHPRLSNLYYYSALVSVTDLNFDVSQHFYPHLSEVLVNEWRAQYEKTASTVDVPEEGHFDVHFHDADGAGGEGLGPEDNCAVVAEAKRPPAYNMAFAQRMQMAIEGALPAKSPLWKEYCMFQKQFLDNVTRRCITQPGVGAHLRKRGIADAAQGRGRQGHKRKQPSEKQHLSTHHRSNDDEESSDDEQPMGWTVVGLTGNRARAILKKGAATDWILEVYPDIEASQYKEGDRWFAKVVDGRIFGLSNSLEIGGVRWCKTNSIQVDPAYPEPVRLEVSMVIAYGPSTAPMFQKFKE
jgi:hypothetical protein